MKLYIQNSDNVFAMADTKSNIAAKLEETTRPICKHIIKVLLYDSIDLHHWETEIYAMLHNISRLKTNNKFPKDSFIFKNTYEVNIQSIPVWIENIKKDYGEPNYNLSDRDIIQKIKTYYQWISRELSLKGDISKHDIFQMLDSLRSIK